MATPDRMAAVNPPNKLASFSKITWNAQPVLVPQLMAMIVRMIMMAMMIMAVTMMMTMMMMMLIPALWSPRPL